jgi:hypothetical protein
MENMQKNEIEMSASLNANSSIRSGMERSTHYRIEAFRDGQPLWTEEFDNLVVTAGLNDSLDKHFKGSSYSAAWYVGITAGTPNFQAADTMASHSGWTEVTSYDEAARRTLTLGTVSGGSVDQGRHQRHPLRRRGLFAEPFIDRQRCAERDYYPDSHCVITR